MRFAFLPTLILPTAFAYSMAKAPLKVAALIASSGSIFIPIQAIETTRFILPEGEDPGLKSDANAMAQPASIIFLAAWKGMRRKKAAEGNKVPIDRKSTRL